MAAILHTDRLRLEPCHAGHFDGLRVVNADPEVMRFIGGRPQTADETRAWIERAETRWRELGHAWWAIVLAGSDGIIGACCVQHIENDPAKEIEIGWRLLPEHWGHGYATEAARAMLDYGFGKLRLPRIFSIADPRNAASTRVMERLGMRSLGLQRHYGTDAATYVLDRPRATGGWLSGSTGPAGQHRRPRDESACRSARSI